MLEFLLACVIFWAAKVLVGFAVVGFLGVIWIAVGAIAQIFSRKGGNDA
jgi:hypothetical protein